MHYDEIALTAFNIYKMKALLEAKLPNQHDFFNNLQWTRKIRIDNNDEDSPKSSFKKLANEGVKDYQDITNDKLKERCKFTPEEFRSLVSYLSNLKKINIKESENGSVYLALLRDIDSTTHLKRIEIVDTGAPGYQHDPKEHLATFYSFHSTLSHLVLKYEKKCNCIY